MLLLTELQLLFAILPRLESSLLIDDTALIVVFQLFMHRSLLIIGITVI